MSQLHLRDTYTKDDASKYMYTYIYLLHKKADTHIGIVGVHVPYMYYTKHDIG